MESSKMGSYKRIIIVLIALAAVVSASLYFNKDNKKTVDNQIPEITTAQPSEEPKAPAEEKGNEYKLTSYYEEIPLSDMSSLTGTITNIVYGGGHMYALTDDVAYTSGTGYIICNIDGTTLQRGEEYNSPEGFTYRNDSPAGLPDDFALGENDTLYTIFNDRVLYGNDKGVCVKDFRTKTERIIERAGTTGMEVVGAFFDGKKYMVVYQEKAQTLKHFYATDADGVVSEETKMTLGYDGKIENTYVNAAGDLYFTKVERTSDGGPAAVTPSAAPTVTPSASASPSPAGEADEDEDEDEEAVPSASPSPSAAASAAPAVRLNETTKIELYRMKPDGSLNRMVGGEKLPLNIQIDDFFVSAQGDIFIQETDASKGRTIQRFDQYGIRTATFNLDVDATGKFFCFGEELWLAYTDTDGSVSLAPIAESGSVDTAKKIITEIGSVESILSGDALYDLYITDQSSVYGVKMTDRTYEEIMQWTDADISPEDRNCIGIMDASSIYCLTEGSREVITMVEETEAVPVEPVSDDETDNEYEDTDEDTEDEDSDDSEETDDEDEDSEDSEDEDAEKDADAETETEENGGAQVPPGGNVTYQTVQKQVTTTETFLRPMRLAKANEQRLAEINSRRIITVAGDIYTSVNIYGEEYSIPEMIKAFNKSNDQYFIHPKNYIKFESSSDSMNGIKKLEQDMEEGFTPDFIIYNPEDNDFADYAAKGKFADIRDLMGSDPEVNESDLLENIVPLCTNNDIMYRIFPVFSGRTFIANESAVDGKKPWKLSEFLDSAGVSNTVYMHEEDALDDILPVFAADHTDFTNSSCDFDNAEFRKLLRWADAFLSVEEALERYGTDYSDDKVYDIRFETLSSPAKLNYEESVTQEDQIIKGVPSSADRMLEVTPGVCFSVLKTSDAKDASWQFIRKFFTDDFYGWGDKREFTKEQMKKRIDFTELPVRKSALDKLIDDSVSMKFEHMLYGDDYAPKYTSWGDEYDLPEISKSTAELFKKAVTGSAYETLFGTEYYKIIREEAVKYFTDPEMTVEQASANVQRRALAYLLRTGNVSYGTSPLAGDSDEAAVTTSAYEDAELDEELDEEPDEELDEDSDEDSDEDEE